MRYVVGIVAGVALVAGIVLNSGVGSDASQPAVSSVEAPHDHSAMHGDHMSDTVETTAEATHDHSAMHDDHEAPAPVVTTAAVELGHDHCVTAATDSGQTILPLSSIAQAQFVQGQEGQPQPNLPTHALSAGDGCSRPNPKAKPGTELNGVSAQTVGCKCMKKCTNGQTQEDLSRDKEGNYICKNACHKDRCTCPDPCKT